MDEDHHGHKINVNIKASERQTMASFLLLLLCSLCFFSFSKAGNEAIFSEDDELPRYLPKSVMDKLSLTYEIDLTNKFVWGCELASNSTEAPSELVELLKTKTCLEIIQPAALSAINLVKQSALAHQRGEKVEELEDYKNRRSLYEYGKDGDLTGCESGCT